MIGAIVLAAGRSTRFGGTKVVAHLRGIELVRHVVDRLGMAGIREIVVTSGEDASAIERALIGSEARVVRNPFPEAGLSASLRAGVDALPAECTAFFVALGDQPLIDPALVLRLREAWESCNAAAIVPVFRDGERGHPVLFDASMKRFLHELHGDRGARDLLDAMADRVMLLPVDAEAPRDVDTPDDLRALEG